MQSAAKNYSHFYLGECISINYIIENNLNNINYKEFGENIIVVCIKMSWDQKGLEQMIWWGLIFSQVHVIWSRVYTALKYSPS